MIEMKKRELSAVQHLRLKICTPGDVVYLTKGQYSATSRPITTIKEGDPMLVLDMQDYQLFVHKYAESVPTDDDSVAVVNLRSARLHKLHGNREVAYYSATLEYSE